MILVGDDDFVARLRAPAKSDVPCGNLPGNGNTAMTPVRFTRMEDGTQEEFAHLQRLEDEYTAALADRVLGYIRAQAATFTGYAIDRQQHALQAATRALRDGADEELVVAALLHDLGDALAPQNHGEFAAAILRPYVSERTWWIVQHHGIFQAYYFAHHTSGDRHARGQRRQRKAQPATTESPTAEPCSSGT